MWRRTRKIGNSNRYWMKHICPQCNIRKTGIIVAKLNTAREYNLIVINWYFWRIRKCEEYLAMRLFKNQCLRKSASIDRNLLFYYLTSKQFDKIEVSTESIPSCI